MCSRRSEGLNAARQARPVSARSSGELRFAGNLNVLRPAPLAQDAAVVMAAAPLILCQFWKVRLVDERRALHEAASIRRSLNRNNVALPGLDGDDE